MTFGTVKCRRCGVEFRFPKEYGKVLYCSAMCRVADVESAGAQYKGCYKSKYYSKTRRRAMAAGDKIDPYIVYTAHDWMCCLCKEPIDPELRLPDLGAATLEHLVPLADGGTHTWDNVAPSHADCNFKKAALTNIEAEVIIVKE